MANDTYTADANGKVFAGRFNRSAIQRAVDAMPSNTWLQINNNSFSQVWPEFDLRAPYLSGKASSSAIIRAWSSFAWDSKNSRMVLWGGGHANTAANEPYVFDGNTGLWDLAFYPSDYYSADGRMTPICGGWRQPSSAHTYDNQIYSPRLDRFLTFGGAQHSDGGQWRLYDGDGSNVFLRNAMCYSLDLTLAGQGLVAGANGDNAVYNGPDLQGANAWTVRDWLGLQNPPAIDIRSVSCGTAITDENGKDVLYKTLASIGGAKSLYRIELDANWQNDVITKVGRAWNGSAGDGIAAYDPAKKIFVFGNTVDGRPYVFWDLKYASTTNNDQILFDAGLTGPAAAEILAMTDHYKMGMDYNPNDGYIYLWHGGGDVYRMLIPDGDPTPATGWYVEKVTHSGQDRPLTYAELDAIPNAADTGVLGKWEYASDLGAFVALQHCLDGNVWVYKP